MKGGLKKYFLICIAVTFIYGMIKPLFVNDYMIVDNGKEYYAQIQTTPKSEGVALDYSIKRIYKKVEPYELIIYSNLPDDTRLNIYIKSSKDEFYDTDTYEDFYIFYDQPIIDGKATFLFGNKLPLGTSQIDISIKYAFMVMPPEVVGGKLVNHQSEETRSLLGENGEDIRIATISANKLSVRSSKEIDFYQKYYYFMLEDSIPIDKYK